MQLNELKNVVVKKAFGGMNISFYGKTQFGGLTMKMYIANHQFGTDLKEQKNHLKLFAEHLSNKNMAVEITEKKAIEEPQSKQSRINPMQDFYPVELVREIEVDESERNKYYVIGSYIGDGSHIVTDSKGNVYYLDHVTGMEKTTFSDFINQWLIDILKDELEDNGLDEM